MNNQKGFTLMGMIVAIGLVVLGMAVITGDLLSFFHKGRVAGAAEEYQAVTDALRSAIMREQGHISDRTAADCPGGVLSATCVENDLLDELVSMNYLDRRPQSISGATWRLASESQADGKIVYFVDIDCGTNDECISVAEELDIRQDGGDGEAAGTVLWSN